MEKEGKSVPQKRTTHRSTGGKKLYAVRDAQGQFKDIQTYKRAHSQDLKRKSAAEKAVATPKRAAGKAVATRSKAAGAKATKRPAGARKAGVAKKSAPTKRAKTGKS